MKLSDIINRTMSPEPWAEGDNIPWHEPGFSGRMLREHISQEHNAASRRFETIDRHVAWIHGNVLEEAPSRILELGCGPGLNLQRLAGRGHTCTGIDYSPASIAYAKEQADKAGLDITYVHGDMREADFGEGFDLVLLVYGEMNIFRRRHAEDILTRAGAALRPGGRLVIEAHTEAIVRKLGEESPSWSSSTSGLFSETPYLYLQEHFWDEAKRTATIRHMVIDAATAEVTHHAQSFQAYSDEEYRFLLEKCGFSNVISYPSLTGTEDGVQEGLMVLVAEK
jgi:SAM-dependent methyltransferase